MDTGEIESLIGDLAADETRNFSILNFVRDNPVLRIDRVGGSVLIRGRSDQTWIYASSSDPEELRRLAHGLSAGDDHYAAIEPWMVPILRRGREIAWSLSMVRFTLPAGALLPTAEGALEPLLSADAATVFEHSDYAEYISVDYARSRIGAGPAVGVREGGELVAWGMTQDDGAMGFLHVMDEYRNRGYGRRITIALAAELRRRGRLPFAYISQTNGPAIALVSGLGFERGDAVQWFRLC